MKLNLGVIDIPYAYEQQVSGKKGKPLKRTKKVVRSITTGEVADIIEGTYGVMEFFFDRHGDEIADKIADSYEGALANVMAGGPFNPDPGQEGLEWVEQRFRDFLSNKEMDGWHDGIPTEAARRGVSHRFAKPYARRPSRPSFIDTGQYQAGFRAWAGEF